MRARGFVADVTFLLVVGLSLAVPMAGSTNTTSRFAQDSGTSGGGGGSETGDSGGSETGDSGGSETGDSGTGDSGGDTGGGGGGTGGGGGGNNSGGGTESNGTSEIGDSGSEQQPAGEAPQRRENNLGFTLLIGALAVAIVAAIAYAIGRNRRGGSK